MYMYMYVVKIRELIHSIVPCRFYPVDLISIQIPALVRYYFEAGVSHFLQGIPVLRYFFLPQCTCINPFIQVHCGNFPL
jgi:hypothetical protein